jgi:hypothetical protein
MSEGQQIIQLLQEVKATLLFNQSEYCNTEEACKMLGVTNYRYLGQLYNRDLLKRYKRADGYVYKKKDLDKLREMLDNETIVLYPLSKNKSNGRV